MRAALDFLGGLAIVALVVVGFGAVIAALLALGSFLHAQQGGFVVYPVVYEAGEALGIHDQLDGLYFVAFVGWIAWFARKIGLRRRASKAVRREAR